MGNWKLRFKKMCHRERSVAISRINTGDCHVVHHRRTPRNDKMCNLLLILFSLFIISCGGISTNTTPAPSPPTPDNSPATSQPQAIILGANFTDVTGTLSLLNVNTPRTPTKNLQTTHSDAIVRVFDNKIYVVNRLGGDNIQIVDPITFHVTLQCSTGQATNPQDIVVVSPTKAYVTLYSPGNNHTTTGLTVNDLLIVNPSATSCDTFITNSLDLTPFTANDGERYARASSLLLIGDRLFIAVQDLPRNLALPPDQPGKIVVLDTRTNTFLGSIVLSGRDPIAMTYSTQTGMIYVADADFFNLSSPYGGIEVVSPNSFSTQGILVDDSSLGGAVGDIETSGALGFVTVGFQGRNVQSFSTKVVSFHLDGTGTPTDIYQGRSYIQDIAVDPNGKLFIGDRDPLVNGIVVMDPSTQNIIDGPINTGPAPSSIAFVESAASTITPTPSVTTPTSSPTPLPSSPSSPPTPITPQHPGPMPPPTPQASYPSRVVSFTPGPGAGWGQDHFPNIVLGPPEGWGLFEGSTDSVLSLGHGGTIILEFTDYIIFDGPGVDFTVFENAFAIGGNLNLTFAEPAYVAVSDDGINFLEFPCNPNTRPYTGCAGVTPVYSNSNNHISATDPTVSGGDSFDLAQMGLQTARFVRIRDANVPIEGPVGATNAGFDLDGIAIVQGTQP